MIWKRLKKASPEQEADFRERMTELEKGDKLALILSAFLVIVLPCLAVLAGLGALILWIFGAL